MVSIHRSSEDDEKPKSQKQILNQTKPSPGQKVSLKVFENEEIW